MAEKGGVPDSEQAKEHGKVALEGRGAEVVVHVVGAVEELADDGERVLERERHDTDAGADAVAAADPVPEPEDGVVFDAEGTALVHGGGHGDDVGRDDFLLGLGGGGGRAQRADEPVAEGAGVEHGLGGGEGLGDHNDQRGLRVEALQGAGDVDGVNVGKEAEAAALGGGGSVALVAQGLEDEFGAEVGAADADGHDVREGLAGNAGALAAANSVGECLHAIQHGVHVGHNVLAVHSEGGALGRAERSVCHGAVLRDVEVLAAEHGGNLALKACGAGKVVELAHGLDSDPLAAVVKHDAGVLCKHGDAPVLVVEKIAQVGGPDGLGMRLQGGPLGGGPDAGSPSGRCGCCGGHAAFVAGSVLSDARPAAVEAGRGADGVASRRKLCDAPDARKRICPAQQRFPSAGHS
mmetsp:Transcript_21455/g.81734  ORF Transcript_21455/g.81734 Transcript_21455/m.81734 type:complete len:408 (+) Transcript_21455:806-2029(+)